MLRDAGATVSVATAVYLGNRRAVARAPEAAFVVDEDDTPLLLHATESLDSGIIADLIARGAPVTARDRFGESALHRVADVRHADPERACAVATMLIDRGAAVDGSIATA